MMKNTALDENFWRKAAAVTAIVWIAAQVIVIVRLWGAPQYADMGVYISTAERCFAAGEWYPMAEDVHSYFIWAPGYINYLILQLRLLGTVDLNAVLNLLLNIAMAFMVYRLGRKFFSERVGLIAAIIFCSQLSNLFIVAGANTENPFLFLCLLALCLVFSGEWRLILCAAPVFALANWIRPQVIVFLLASVVYLAATRARPRSYAALLVPYILCLLATGAATEKKIGRFVYQSTTAGYNLVSTANDSATGTVMLFGSEAYHIENIESLTFAQRDSVWTSRALAWIGKNPAKYAALYVKKIPGLYVHDNWAHMSHQRKPDSWESWYGGGAAFAVRMAGNALLSIPYYIAFMFFFYAVWANRKNLLSVKSIFLVIFVTGTLAVCVFSVAFRFHYPFMFTVFIWAAHGVDTFINKRLAAKIKDE